MKRWILVAAALGATSTRAVAQRPPLLETVTVAADKAAPVMTTQPLTAGATYVIEVRGVISLWSDHQDGVDAYYCYAPWRCARPELWAQLLVDDRPMVEIAKANGDPSEYRADHMYTTSVHGTGGPLRLQVADAKGGSAVDNRGSLQVSLYGYPATAQGVGTAPTVYPYPAQQPGIMAQGYPQQQVYPQQPIYQAPPRAPRVTYGPRWGLFGAGLGLLVGGWLFDVAITHAADLPPESRSVSRTKSVIPIAGPLLQLEDNLFTDGTAGEAFGNIVKAWLVIDFLVQVAGLTLAVLGASLWHKVTHYSDMGGRRITLLPGGRGGSLAIAF